MKIYLISNVAFVMQLQTKSFIYLITNFGHKTPQIYKWTMLYKGTPPITKIDFFQALPEKGGGALPEFVDPFFHHAVPYILTSISC